MQSNRKHQLTQFQDTASRFIALSVGWLFFLFIIRIAEFIYVGTSHQFPSPLVPIFLLAWLNDLVFFLKLSFVLLVIYFLITLIHKKAATIVYICIALLITIVYFALIQYFNATLIPLGADLYGYSWKDMQQTVGASGRISVMNIVLLLGIAIMLIVWLIGCSKKIKITGSKNFYWLIAMAILWITVSNLLLLLPVTGNDFDKNMAKNKADFFLAASKSHFFPELPETDIYSDAYIGDYSDIAGTTSPIIFSYPDEKNYPFLHEAATADVLSPFFKKTQVPPHIVIVAIEGLGRAFSNQGAYLGSFTPFLDSLSEKSLYWENCLSNGGRTFALLPSLLGSLPFGKNGFNELSPLPPHLSLMSLLKKEGYYTSFYYGGDASFDRMKTFLQQQQVNDIFDQQTFPSNYQRLPAFNGFTWGYGDKELYQYFFTRQVERNLQPSLQVLLTVTTHNPFLINNQVVYTQYLDQYLSKQNFSEEQKRNARHYSLQYSTILYADESLRYFFNEYKKQPGYDNTIFIITGDHRMPEIPMSTKIDRFHVPLIMYSPLLQRSAKFSSLSSHFDVTPSLLAYLKNNFNVRVPSLISWLGSGLDTAPNRRNIHVIPLMQTKTDMVDFVLGNYHLNGNDVYELSDQLEEKPVSENNIKQKLQSAFQSFRQKNDRLVRSSQLIPDSIYKTYFPQ